MVAASFSRTPIGFGRGAGGARRLLPAAAVIVVGSFVAYRAGAAVATGLGLVPLAVAGTAGFAFAWSAPRTAAIAALALAYAGVPTAAHTISVLGLTTDVVEAILSVLILRWAVSSLLEQTTPRTSLEAPVLLFAFAVLVGLWHGVTAGAPRQQAQGEAKALLLSVAVLPLAALFSRAEEKELLERCVVAIATIGAAVVCLQVLAGRGPVSDRLVNTLGQTVEVQRLRPPLLGLLFVATLLALARIVRGRRALLETARLGLFVIAWGLSFNRSSWGPMLLAGLAVILLRPATEKRGRRIGGLVVAVLVFASLWVLASRGSFGATGRAVSSRVSSIASDDLSTDASYRYRAIENQLAVEAIGRQPVFGAGVGQGVPVPDPANPGRTRPFLHNTFFFAWIQLGLLGIGALAFGAWRVARMSTRALRSLPASEASRCLAGGIAVAGMAAESLFQTSLHYRPTILGVVVSLALAAPPQPRAAPPSTVASTGSAT